MKLRLWRTAGICEVNEVLCTAWADAWVGDPLAAREMKLNGLCADALVQALPLLLIERGDDVLTVQQSADRHFVAYVLSYCPAAPTGSSPIAFAATNFFATCHRTNKNLPAILTNGNVASGSISAQSAAQ